MSIKITINVDELAKQFKEFAEEAKRDLEEGVKTLAASTKLELDKLANKGIKSPSKKDIWNDNNTRYEEISPGIHVISVLQPAVWIEEGLPAFDMKPGILKGKSSVVVPFHKESLRTGETELNKNLIKQVRDRLAEEKLTTKNIEVNSDGSPRIGRLHVFNIDSPQKGKSGTPFLHRLSVYQSVIEEGPKKGKIQRDILTFRTVSIKSDADSWRHPKVDGKKFLDKAADFFMNEWESKVLPDILKKWDVK